ncbi:MAG: hypothetical protein ACLU20_08105 [Thomasclavelia spiroformis]
MIVPKENVKVIVIINAVNQMEIQELADDPNIGAIYGWVLVLTMLQKLLLIL